MLITFSSCPLMNYESAADLHKASDDLLITTDLFIKYFLFWLTQIK